MGVLAAIQQVQIVESFLLQRYQHTGDNLLPLYGVSLQTVGHDVVDVLDEDDISLNLVQVLNQRAVTAGTEQQ